MTKLSNLEIIKRAWEMGWSATVFHKAAWENISRSYQVIDESLDNVMLYSYETKNYFQAGAKDINEKLEITGYLYAGQLAGNEHIPEGQRFIDKKTGVELKLIEKLPPIPSGIPSRFFLRMSDGKTDETHVYFKEEIEPYFE